MPQNSFLMNVVDKSDNRDNLLVGMNKRRKIKLSPSNRRLCEIVTF